MIANAQGGVNQLAFRAAEHHKIMNPGASYILIDFVQVTAHWCLPRFRL